MTPSVRRAARFAVLAAQVVAPACGGDARPTAPGPAAAATPAGATAAVNMTLLAQLPLAGMSRGATSAAGLWGFTTASGRRFALVGLSDGTAVVDLTDPARPRTTGLIVGEPSTWREVRPYGDTAYVSTEANTGLDIIDLRNPDQPLKVQTWNRTFTSAHSLEIETERGLLLVNGTRDAARADRGLRVLDVARNPRDPSEAGSFTGFYVHDAYPRGSRIYAAAIRDGFLGVLDFSDPSRIVEITRFFTGGRFTHNAWLTGDARYLFTTDERSGRPVEGWDIADVFRPRKVSEYNARPTGVPHNVVIDGTRLFVAHYGDGVHVLDVANPESPRLIGSYDTYAPPSDGFDGCWGVYPFPGSDLVIASDRQGGLFVLQLTGR
jgi:choice-of-anchor B domain-containing protein